ncbi:MAG: hypothetical protein Q9M36_05960 [Sulfurovum sp.]|nr:hypothetical protein [Sulfurovum sp.]
MVTKEDLAKAILDLGVSMDKRHAKTEATVEKVAKLIGNISNNQGHIAEEFFYNSISANPTLNGIDYDFTDKNITRKKIWY